MISVRGRDRGELLADPGFVYVGRACRGWPASPFANPFKAGDHGPLARTIFSEWLSVALAGRWDVFDSHPKCARLRPHFEGIVRGLPGLRGKVLGCWCGGWAPGEPDINCHAVTLARLVDGLGGLDGEETDR